MTWGEVLDISILQIQNGIFEFYSTNGKTFLAVMILTRDRNYWIEKNELNKAESAGHNKLAQKLRSKAEETKKAFAHQVS